VPDRGHPIMIAKEESELPPDMAEGIEITTFFKQK
jgi:hypothetical protein